MSQHLLGIYAQTWIHHQTVDSKLRSFGHAVRDAFDVHVPLKERSVSYVLVSHGWEVPFSGPEPRRKMVFAKQKGRGVDLAWKFTDRLIAANVTKSRDSSTPPELSIIANPSVTAMATSGNCSE